jgi:hypothetical protein
MGQKWGQPELRGFLRVKGGGLICGNSRKRCTTRRLCGLTYSVQAVPVSPSVMLSGNPWQVGPEYESSGGMGTYISYPHTFSSVTVQPGQVADLSFAGKVQGVCKYSSGTFTEPSILPFYTSSFLDGTGPNISPGPCWISGFLGQPACPAYWPYIFTLTPAGWHPSDLGSQQVAQQLTPSNHTYPNAPISTNCRVSTPFDAIINPTTKAPHAAQDISNTTHDLQVGAPVYAPEGGTVHIQGGYPHINQPASQCAGQHYPANYINITDANGNRTRLVHVTALPGLSEGQTVSAGQQVGTVDNSGCTSAPHVHMSRKQAGTVVNFTIPCDNSHFDSSGFYDDSDGLDNQ